MFLRQRRRTHEHIVVQARWLVCFASLATPANPSGSSVFATQHFPARSGLSFYPYPFNGHAYHPYHIFALVDAIFLETGLKVADLRALIFPYVAHE